MLQSLHVKNLALMEETEVSFGEGLNVLTGETGAGKSLLLGSVNLALGAKFDKDMLRKGAESALVELSFSGNEKVRERLLSMELETQEDGSVLITRKMQVGKSVFRINGEVVTAKQVKELAEVLIDIHGQHEHQSLLHKKKHLEILDAFGGKEAQEALSEVSVSFHAWKELLKELSSESLDEKERAREQSLAEYECQEIVDAALRSGEDEELEETYRVMVNGQKIMEALGESYSYTSSDGAGSALSRALRALGSVSGYDKRLAELEDQLAEVDSLLADYNRDIADYMEDVTFDEEALHETEERLNLINRLKEKYGNTIEEIIGYGEERQAYLEKLSDYDAYLENLKANVEKERKKLAAACEKLSKIRKKNAKTLTGLLTKALEQLGFLTVDFEIHVGDLEEPTEKGADDVEFLISTNPGEERRPLGSVASGGELSRIMLAIKTVLAERDEVDALIFDEIDSGISGKTAWQVSGQLGKVSKAHQVICITHLPQIAAMGDSHFLIEKSTDGSSTSTNVRLLTEVESIGELARLLGSDELSEAAITNAQDMRRQALERKEQEA
ncbi:MAG: DNA repair protein RecN [Lachnospiraceae bacterium]|nr:DNA repair protein RecN [Lachnospiraceae bacterium]